MVMAGAGSAIGIGTLWQSPYMIDLYGGGTFLFWYLGALFIIGVPMLITELLLGKQARCNVVSLYRQQGHGLVGWVSWATSIITLSYYYIVGGWGLHYIFLLLIHALPSSAEAIRSQFMLLEETSWITLFWSLLFIALSSRIVERGVHEGIERWSKRLIPLLILFLFLLGILGTFLGGGAKTFHFLTTLKPITPDGIMSAIGLACFTLSVGQGVMLTYGSYTQTTMSIPKLSATIGTVVALVSLLSAGMVFSMVFAFDLPTGEGKSLVFTTLPVLFVKVPFGTLFAALFFSLFFFAALTSAISYLEVSVAYWEEGGNSRFRGTWYSGILILILALPSIFPILPHWKELYQLSFFESMVQCVTQFLTPFLVLYTSIMVGWGNKERRIELTSAFCDDGSLFLKKSVSLWLWMIRWVIPLIMITLILDSWRAFGAA